MVLMSCQLLQLSLLAKYSMCDDMSDVTCSFKRVTHSLCVLHSSLSTARASGQVLQGWCGCLQSQVRFTATTLYSI